MWIFAAFIAAVFMAATRLANQVFRQSGIHLLFSVKGLMALYALPFLFFVPWPQNPWFYFFALSTTPFVLFQDWRLFDFTARYGAGPVTRIEPLSVPFVFICWLILHPALWQQHGAHPLPFVGIVCSLFLTVFFAMRLRRCDVHGPLLIRMIPLIAGAGIINMLAKTSMDLMDTAQNLPVYFFIQSLTVAFFCFPFVRREKGKASTCLRRAALTVSGLTVGIMVFRLWAFRHVSNPAYVTAVMLTGPFWTALINKLRGETGQGNLRDGFGIVLSAMALTLCVCLEDVL